MYPYLGDTGIELYSLLGMFSTIVLFCFNLSQIKKKKTILSYKSLNIISRNEVKNNRINRILASKTFWAVIETIIISCVQYLPIGFLNTVFGRMVGTGGNYFGIMLSIPFIMFFICYLLGINPLKQMDLITPAFPIALYFSKLACFCCGCCRGVQWDKGLYNYNSDLVEFPTQLLEAVLALLIFFILIYLRGKVKIGTMYPIYMILFCVTRFFSEFTRVEEKVIGYFNTYQILCVFGLVIGLLEYSTMHKYGQSFSDSFYEKSLRQV